MIRAIPQSTAARAQGAVLLDIRLANLVFRSNLIIK